MATCAVCDTTILFGGKNVEGHRVCNDKCLARKREELSILNSVSDDDARARADLIRHSPCPRCGTNARPIDVQLSYETTAALFVYWARTRKLVACKSCGNGMRWKSVLVTLCLGLWSPHGFIRVPMFIARNLIAMFHDEKLGPPSELLLLEARLQILRERDQRPALAARTG